jgi:hypothetical protein
VLHALHVLCICGVSTSTSTSTVVGVSGELFFRGQHARPLCLWYSLLVSRYSFRLTKVAYAFSCIMHHCPRLGPEVKELLDVNTVIISWLEVEDSF